MCHRVSEKGCSRIHQFSHWLVGRSCFPAISIYFWCKETKLNVLLGSQYVAAARARPRQHAASLLHKAVWVFVLLFSLDIPSLLLEGDMSLWQGGSKHRHCCPGKLKLIQLWLAEFLVAWETESNLTKIPVLDKRTLSTELGVKGHWPFIIWNSKPSILFIIIYNTFLSPGLAWQPGKQHRYCSMQILTQTETFKARSERTLGVWVNSDGSVPSTRTSHVPWLWVCCRGCSIHSEAVPP